MQSELKKAAKFPVLDPENFNRIRDNAISYAISRVVKPVFNESDAEVSDYPRSFLRPVNALLLLEAILSFFISAGKQALAIYMIMSPVAERLGSGLGLVWMIIAVLGGIVLSEAGSLLFQIVAVPLSRGSKNVKRIFYVYSVMCVALALLGNVVITSTHQFTDPLFNVYLWFFTIFNPILVLGVGTVYERQFMMRIVAYASAKKVHRESVVKYDKLIADPESLPDFKANFVSDLIQAMKVANPRMVGGLLKESPTNRHWLAAMEYRSQLNQSMLDLNADFEPVPTPVPNGTDGTNSDSTPPTTSDGTTENIDADGVEGSRNNLVQGRKSSQNGTGVTKLDQAVALLREFPELCFKKTRELNELYPNISTMTWSRALNRKRTQDQEAESDE